VRVEKACDNAMAMAEFLEAHPEIGRILYPGLSSHPQHALAVKQFGGFGTMLAFELKGGFEAVRSLCNALEIITPTVSLGETDTIISHPASSSHVGMSPGKRLELGITDGLVRLSVGIEDADDLVEDLKQALEAG
jgi:methionine-gamma-lyase